MPFLGTVEMPLRFLGNNTDNDAVRVYGIVADAVPVHGYEISGFLGHVTVIGPVPGRSRVELGSLSTAPVPLRSPGTFPFSVRTLGMVP